MWLFAVLAVVVVGGVLIYNGLVRLGELTDTAWADIDVQLKRRHDLVPNLVETVKGYAGHEREALEAVIEARALAISAREAGPRAVAEERLTGSLQSLFALAESYPELKAAEGFQSLHESLVDIEDHIQNARRYYNAVVRDYNIKIGQVPSNLIARSFGFDERDFFTIAEGEGALPEVGFDRSPG